jgi:hypothetical protein
MREATHKLMRRFHAAAADDSGIALATVAAISAILFLLASTLLMLAVQQQVSDSHYVGRTKALNAADAGLTDYLFNMNRDPNYPATHTSVGPVATSDGSWSVVATSAAGSGASTWVIRATGTIPSMAATRTIVANVMADSFAAYAFLIRGDDTFGSTALVTGRVRSNGNIINNGTITGRVLAHGTVTGSGTFQSGYQAGAPEFPWANISSQLTSDAALANADGCYYPPLGTGYLGYRVVLNGNGGTVQKVTAVNSTTGALTLDSGYSSTFTSHGNQVVYFDDKLWIQGTYSAPMTICSGDTYIQSGSSTSKTPVDGSSIFITGNLTAVNNTDPNHILGLLTAGDTSLTCWYTGFPSSMTLEAATVSGGSFHGDDPGTIKTLFTLNGSITSSTQVSMSNAFSNRVYNWDGRLLANPPPNYPKTGFLSVSSWIEN